MAMGRPYLGETKKLSMTMFPEEWVEIENSTKKKAEIMRLVLRPFLRAQLIPIEQLEKVLNSYELDPEIQRKIIRDLEYEAAHFKLDVLYDGENDTQFKLF